MEDMQSHHSSVHSKLYCALRRSASMIEHSLFEPNERKESLLYRRYNKSITSPLPKITSPKYNQNNSVSFKSPIHSGLPESAKNSNEVLANSIMKIKKENKKIALTRNFNIKKYNNKIVRQYTIFNYFHIYIVKGTIR